MKRVLVVALLLGLLGLPAVASLHASGPNQVGLVVRFGDGSVFTRCVEFSEPTISGYEVLARAGLNVIAEFSGLGVAVCKVQNDGCNYPAQSCFCQCEGSPCYYWVYHHLVGGAWQYSGFGASSYQVGHGAVEGWAWGEGDPNGGSQPPVLTFEQLCAPPTATPLPTATLAPTATSTPAPAATGTPAPTVWFRVDQNPIAAGACTTLRWDAGGVKSVALDGQTVAPSGTRQVCPVAPQRYELRVITLGGTEQRYPIDLGVTGATPTQVSGSTPVATATSLPGATVIVPTHTPTAAPETAAVSATPVTASPSLTVTPRPPATDEVVVIAAPTLPATATPVEVAALPAEPAAAAADLADDTAVDPSPDLAPYLVFGGLVVALVGVLLLVTWRRRTA
jgi:hypothetical protein